MTTTISFQTATAAMIASAIELISANERPSRHYLAMVLRNRHRCTETQAEDAIRAARFAVQHNTSWLHKPRV